MKLLVSALERSANVHLAALVRNLGPELELSGIFDRTLGTPLSDLQSLSVMGFRDALGSVPMFLRLAERMTRAAAEADAVLLMDASGFNLPLAKKIRRRYPQKRIIYYILPQAWAWKRRRIPVLERTCDRLLSILPFEERYYGPRAPIEYVGHPLLDEIPNLRRTSPPRTVRSVAFLPGSRRSEIRSLMPVYREVRRRIGLPSLLVVPPHFSRQRTAELYGDTEGFRIVHDTHSALLESDFAFVCSGTATLEAALIGTPLVLSYIAKPLDYWVVKSLIRIRYAGLANLFSLDFQGRPMHPELLQYDATPRAHIAAFEQSDPERFFRDSLALREYLGHGSAGRVAEIIRSLEVR